MTKYVALYPRISKDKRGRVEGVRAQEKWGREYAAREWSGVPVRVFADNDLSAADQAVHRPGYEALREAIGRGEVAHLWAVEQSRLERTEIGWFRFAAELDAAGIDELHTNRDGVVRVRDDVAGIKAVLAAGEVRRLKRRVNDRLAEIALEGRPAGSRVYGYAHGLDETGGKTLHIVKDEAEAIREAASLILAGWSLARVAAHLRAKGHHGAHIRKVRDADGDVIDTRPTAITAATVKGMVTNATVAGWRTHQGRRTKGVWKPILDEATWTAVRNKLAAPRVVERVDGSTYPINEGAHVGPHRRRYLLTGGIAVCGVCGNPLVASVKQLKRGRKPSMPYYLCHPNRGGGGCIGIMADAFEKHVVSVLLDELDKPEFQAALAADQHAERRAEIEQALVDVDRKRSDLAAAWARPASDDDALTEDEWRIARQGLRQQERDLHAELASMPPPAVNVDVSEIRESWPDMNLDERRELVGMFIERVTVDRAKPGTKGFDQGRVREPVWRPR